MTFVTDASVAAAWVLPDEEAAIADLALERLGEETVKVPNVFWIDSFAQIHRFQFGERLDQPPGEAGCF